MLGAYCGTSWEGTQWVSRGDLRTQFRWGLDARLGSMLLAMVASALVAMTALLFAAPAYAHGTACYTEAWKPYPVSGGIAAKSVGSCQVSGYWHNFRTQIYKNINNWPDALVGKREGASADARVTVYASGVARGCGVYYSTGRVRYHDSDRSNRNYYRC